MMSSDRVLKWRVNLSPRFTVLEMGEYMAAEDGPRETMLRDMKYERLAGTLKYGELRKAVANFVASPTRDRRILARFRDELEQKIDAAIGQKRENLLQELRALETFEGSLNALGMAGLNFERAPPSGFLKLEGVKISVQPTAHIRAIRPRGCDLVGAIIIDLAKGTSPKTDPSIARITDGMTHAAILVHQYVEGAFVGQDVKASQPHCIIFHTHRQERVRAPDNYKKMLRNVEAVCRNISRGWEGIVPPPSFNENEARFRH